jgi:hypothetical protein
MRMKFYNELEQSWRKLKQDYPEVAKAIAKSDEREYLAHGDVWKIAIQPTPYDHLVYRAPMQTEADKFLAKWGGKKVCRVSGISDWIIFDSVYGCCDDSVIGNDNCGLKVVTKDFRDPTWKLWEPPKPKLDTRRVAGWWCTWGSKKESVMVNTFHNNGQSLVTPAGIHWSIEQIEADKSITFSKDIMKPIDQWQTLEEICGGES